jgi:hypothetical protein
MEGRKTTDPDKVAEHSDSRTALHEAPDASRTVTRPPEIHESEEALDSDEDTSPGLSLPKIERLPEGMEVVERPLGHAKAQWLLQVRCECGRRWFELHPIETATCPRCGTFLVVKIEGRGRKQPY